MNTEPKDGGPAFPLSGKWEPNRQDRLECLYVPGQPGISIRDYFAAHALQGMMTEGFMPNMASQPGNTRDFNYAVAAYAIADAMLKAREQKE